MIMEDTPTRRANPEAEFLDAARTGDVEGMRLKIQEGNLDPRDTLAQKAIEVLCTHGYKHAFQVLIEWKVPLRDFRTVEGHGPLHLAAYGDHDELMEVLLGTELARELNAPNLKQGLTPAEIAIEQEHTAVLTVLLEHNASLPADADSSVVVEAARNKVNVNRLRKDLLAAAAEVPDGQTDTLETEMAKCAEAVWANQREHMRMMAVLDRLKVMQKLRELVAQEEELRQIAEASRQREASLSTDQMALNRQLEDARTELEVITVECSANRRVCVMAEDEVSAFRKEHLVPLEEERVTEELRKQKEAANLAEKTRIREELESKVAGLEHVYKCVKVREAQVKVDLEVQSKDLAGWRRDRAAAAELTKKAQLLLG